MKRKWMTGLALAGLLAVVWPAWTQTPDARPQQAPRVFLGITVEPPAEGAAQKGVVVQSVTPDSPAAQAGLKPGDVIARVGDQDVRDFDALLALLAKHKPGDKLAFHVRREGKEQELNVTLAQRQGRVAEYGGEGARQRGGVLGVQTAESKDPAGATVMDVMPDTPAARAGLQRGDVITRVDDKAVTGPDDLREAIQRAGAGKEVRLQVQRGQDKREVTARLGEAPVDGLTFPLPMPPEGFRGRPGLPGVPGVFDAGKIRELERKVQELEKRVRELERKKD